ncbi:hypothetical protein [Ammoniphilus sp. CFH 90114]|uniref:hypothetical protein n=1 Tax=Ammoniphilus sp. CFH 90114 TaxID=2493665 RepID=UPI001F0BB4B8|nr:hypothetical protein [Ammoniphilus sp. CFH 90114]
MNERCEERGSSGINILWPDTDNADFKDALAKAKKGESPNNISAIIKYSLKDGIDALWMGDLETNFMEKIKDKVDWPKVDILFAPHHGRESGKVPKEILDKLDPKIVIIGEAPSEHLNYYEGYNKITQNSAGDIIFECLTNKVNIFVSSDKYAVDFLDNENVDNMGEHKYIGTLNI